MRSRLTGLALLGCALLVARCTCGDPPEGPPPPIGDGDPVDPPDAGDVYDNDAGPVVCAEDDNEDNDVRGDAVDVASDIPVTGTVCGDDDDWFSVTSAPGCTVLAEVTNLAGPEGTQGDVDMLMFDPDGQLVGSSNSPGDVEAIDARATKTGPYAVRLRAGSRDVAPYSLLMSSICAEDLTCPADDRLEDNDSASAPAPLNEGVGHDGILCSTDEDWFFVPAALGCVADARLSFVDATGDIDLELYRADGVTRIANSAGSGDSERITRVVTEGGMRLRAFFFGNAAANGYRLIVDETCEGQIACPGDDPFEPNNDRASARELFAIVDEAIGVICGDDDFFKLTPTTGCTVHATLTFVDAEGDLDLQLQKDGDGSQLAISNGTGDTEQIDFLAPNTGRLALKVSGFSNATNVYRLHVESTCP